MYSNKSAWLLGTISIASLVASFAEAAPVYTMDFDSDPGWTTDQPSNFYWDASTGSYVARTENALPDYTPNRYGTTEINLDVTQSFSITWDQRIRERQGTAQTMFGLYTDDRAASGVTYRYIPFVTPSSTLNLGTGALSYGERHDMNIYTGGIHGSGGSSNGGTGRGAEVGVWFTNTLSYDADASTVSVVRELRDPSDPATPLGGTYPFVYSVSGVFDPGMTNLGISYHPIGYHPRLVWADNPDDYQVTEFDNILVEGEFLVPPTPTTPQLSFPLSGVAPLYVTADAGGNSSSALPPAYSDPYHTGGGYHSVDWDVGSGTADVIAAADGAIVALGYSGKCVGEPSCVLIDHGNGYFTEYREFSTMSSSLALGPVTAGTVLGSLDHATPRRSGCFAKDPTSGLYTTPTTCTPDHLHFQLLYDADGAGPLPMTSAQSVTQLQELRVGGIALEDFELGPSIGAVPFTPGATGFIRGTGDVSLNLDGVLDQTTQDPLRVGASSSGDLIVNGPITLDVQNELTIGTGAEANMFVVNGADVIAESVLVGSQGSLNLNNGFITALDAGVTFGGTMTIGSSPGVGTIYGDFLMTGGLWDVEIAGTEPGMFDVLNIFGDADFLGGTINFSFIDGYTPLIGDSFDFLNVSGETNFESVLFTYSGLPSNLEFFINRSEVGGLNATTVAASSPSPVPLPSGLPLMAAGLGLLAFFGGKRQRRA